MDPPVKAGALLLQQPSGALRLGAKRWKKNWFVLYPASRHGVARLEFFDCKEGASAADRVGTKRLDKTIVRLADCVSVAPAPDSSPKDGFSAFRLETSERAYLFAAELQEATEWMGKLCETAFPSNSGKAAEQALNMATNSIYCSREEACEFWVTVQKTEAAERCKLHGTYVLKASRDSLGLREPHSKQPLYSWPYRLLRRYGRDKVIFSFEAGRRCESGPGNFSFETKKGNEIFQVVEAAIQGQKAQVDENRQSSNSLDSEAPNMAQIQNSMAKSLSLGGEGFAAPEKGLPQTTLTAKPNLAMEEKEADVFPLKGQNQRDPLPLWASSPPCSPVSGLLPSEETGNVYSEPLDAVKGSRPRPDPLYADPVDSRHAGGQAEPAGPGQSDCQGNKGHVYDEPEGRAPWPTPAPAAIYEEAQLPCEAWRTQGLENRLGYELPYQLGAADYAVPAFQQKLGLKPPKPCPAPKPPRAHKKCSPLGSPSKSTAHCGPPLAALRSGSKEPVYSQVLKSCCHPQGSHAGREQSVDESRSSSVYEDLGEI